MEEMEKRKMNKEEYGYIIDLQLKGVSPVDVYDLDNKNDRTLLYGYTCDRDTFHVYIKDMKNPCCYIQNGL